MIALDKGIFGYMVPITKFIKFTVAALTDMRMTLAQLSLGLMSLQENVNAIYEYMRVLSTRRVNPLIIPPDSL